MDEKLTTTIQRIRLLAEQNPEFKQEMQKMFGKATSALDISHDERISQMLKYLGLDAHVDHMDSVIDYSFISEKDIRDKLESDNREMIRFRYGTRYHKTIFEEYCRYAQLQAEMLFNFYYSKVEDTFPKIKEHIKRYNERNFHKKIDESKTLFAISFPSKYWAFANEFEIKDIIDPLDYVCRIRNSQSHRSPDEESFSISDFQKKLRDYGIKLLEDGSINWSELYKNQLAKNLFDSQIKGTPDYSKYELLLWLNKTPYDEIKNTLEIIAETVKMNIVST